MTRATQPWAETLTLGDQRFAILAGGPFDGRCYPLMDGTPGSWTSPAPRGRDPSHPAVRAP